MDKAKERILIIDDEKISAFILRDFLLEDYDVLIAGGGEEALEILEKTNIQLILLDIIMKGMDGYEVCKKIKENPKTSNIPVIFVTARNNFDDESRGLNMGAVDYIKKPYFLPIVAARIKTHIELKNKNDILEKLVSIDALTGIYNRRKYEEYIIKEIINSKNKIGLLMIDIDNFKAYNDNYGHGSGDKCLSKIAKNINMIFKESDSLFARYGGEEFIVVLSNTNKEEMEKYAEKIINKFKEINIEHLFSDVEKHVTASIGGVCGNLDKVKINFEDFAKIADEMMYYSKTNGRNQYKIKDL